MTLIKTTFGGLLFLFGLVVIILSVVRDKSGWWWMLGGAALLVGLKVVIDTKIAEVKKQILGDIDTRDIYNAD